MAELIRSWAWVQFTGQTIRLSFKYVVVNMKWVSAVEYCERSPFVHYTWGWRLEGLRHVSIQMKKTVLSGICWKITTKEHVELHSVSAEFSLPSRDRRFSK